MNESSPRLSKNLRRSGRTRRVVVSDAGSAGWEVREEQDDQILRRALYTDWHRVERALTLFSLELERQGWVEA